MAIHGDPATNRFNPKGPSSLQDCRELLAQWVEHWEVHGFGYWAAVLRDDPETIIGFGGVRRSVEQGGLNLYFRFTPSSWGQGYATELGSAALDMAGKLDCGPVRAQVRASNTPSQRTLARLGMVPVDRQAGGFGEDDSLVYEVRSA